MSLNPQQFYDVMRRIIELDITDDLFYVNDDDGIKIIVNCNDLFWWATADGEEVTTENIVDLERAVKDCIEANPNGLTGAYSHSLFACRMRKMRPQPPCYKTIPEFLRPLFDACGPERDPKNCG